ncbi:iron-containing redox enzyme family protein [Streptomyces purpurogeneiscleroticus]|uniref:iron-containing redox enzyme family protein n=1 Tax=Streptomyces purpurogeneiscleroticus TaxID=68259 RepID=UPI001CBEAC44|nr:iron-containing redox enzyme family protein [Streptomyces purpurogeneiscleroticus]MBZ4018703.1 cupin [Streptomyces purpurogeneiscleroticus]
MSHVTRPYIPFELRGQELRDAVVRYASNPIYLDNEEWENSDNPYRRQLRPQVLPHLDYDSVPGRAEILDYSSLAVQRLLTSIYEADLVFLPKSGLHEETWQDFKSFYSPSNRVLGEMIRPALEKYAFGFLDDEVEVSGQWTKESFRAYIESLGANEPAGASLTEKAILSSADRERAARMWLIQFAPDFLSEASPMIRNVMGYYGATQSEWFKIIIDEYGYGVHDTKHSRLFERTLESAGLQTDIHRYWQYYLNSSLLMNNYFHYLGKNHELFFRYVGALYYTEATLVDFCRRAANLLTTVFGEEIDATYFTEHAHIDQHHGRMALEKLMIPLIEEHGEQIIPEIVRGIEEYRVIQTVSDEDLAAQIAWMDRGPEFKKLHAPVWEALESGRVTAPVADIVEPKGELSNTHCHDGDELCHIVSGTMKFVSGFDSYQILEAGEGTVIQKNRLHGAIIESDECVYQIHSVGDYQKCLS